MYINLGNAGFQSSRNSEYVDKSGLIAFINKTLNTEFRFSCVTRCRRFGKSMAAKMLCAYYDQSCDSRSLFEDLEIARDPSFEQHLNKYPVIYLDMTDFTTRKIAPSELVPTIQKELKEEINSFYPEVDLLKDDDLMSLLIKTSNRYKTQFIMIIDEWDAICREFGSNSSFAMDDYVNMLRRLFKGSNSNQVFAAVYMTGILPIKKYNTQSALNNFREYSMIEPGGIARYFGFTKDEVRALASEHDMDFDELEKWYDGYQIGDQKSMFNPNSLMEAVSRHRCRSYWGNTGAYEAVANYIQMNFDGLKGDIIQMLAGGKCKVDSTMFQNDLNDVRSRDDVLTVLIHLGYLSYDWNNDKCYIPNREVAGEMVNAVKANKWAYVVKALEASERLLRATLEGDEEAVAKGVEAVHDESTSILSYNDENSLACVISLAYYYAKNDYIVSREFPTGKGFADLVMVPRKHVEKPAVVVELKFDDTVDAAIDQIHRRQYPEKIAQYTDRLLLVGISYNRQTKQHTCKIEQYKG